MKDAKCARKKRQIRTRKRIVLCQLVGIFVLIFGILVTVLLPNINSTKDLNEPEVKDEELTVVEAIAPSVQPTGEMMLAYINENAVLYGEALVELANNNEELVDYVYNYPEESKKYHEINIASELQPDELPLFIQWDERWGYIPYGGGMIGYTGCGPTSLSMVAIYLTGNTEYTPDYVAEYAEENGYSVYGNGTSWTLMSEGCKAFGLVSEELCLDEDCMRERLLGGHPIICAMGPGDFTRDGHFIVLTDYKDGKFTVNDPNSPKRSARGWSYEEISNQIRNMWVFYKAD